MHDRDCESEPPLVRAAELVLNMPEGQFTPQIGEEISQLLLEFLKANGIAVQVQVFDLTHQWDLGQETQVNLDADESVLAADSGVNIDLPPDELSW